MIFFYGTGSSTLGPFPLAFLMCTNCGASGSLSVIVFTRYFHFFWIPVFPFQKKAVTVCANCKQALNQNEWPATYQQPALTIKQQTSFPLTNFAGLIMLALVVVGCLITALLKVV